MEKVNEYAAKIGLFTMISGWTGASPGKVALISLVCLICLILTDFGATFVVNLISFLVPAYQSFKYIERRGEHLTNPLEVEEDHKEKCQWITYWCVFSVLLQIDVSLPILTEMIPLYIWLKLVLLIFMFWPGTRGAYNLYRYMIGPILKRYEAHFDSTAEAVGRGAKVVIGAAGQVDATGLALKGITKAKEGYGYVERAMNAPEGGSGGPGGPVQRVNPPVSQPGIHYNPIPEKIYPPMNPPQPGNIQFDYKKNY